MDEIGPISFRPKGGRGRFRAGHPARIPSTYKRRKGTRYLYLTENVYHKRLSGRFYRHKGGTFWSDYLERERSKYPADQRVYIIQDTLSAHWTPEIRRWVHAPTESLGWPRRLGRAGRTRSGATPGIYRVW